ncbi:hypothetical protein TNCV_4210961 [Trichonephila clavipes]|nr:hypothetical protein TNCV_4210961 [Trichonephila clavipes]
MVGEQSSSLQRNIAKEMRYFVNLLIAKVENDQHSSLGNFEPLSTNCGGQIVAGLDSRFSLRSDSRRTLIWRAPGTRYHQENAIERHRYGGAVWLI